MARTILIFGIIAGLIVTATYSASMAAIERSGNVAGVIVGYLVMLIALTFVFAGVKQYRDDHLGGVIRFSTALGVGAAISAIACFFYVAAWELHLYLTDYAFMRDYAASSLAAKSAAGATALELAKAEAEFRVLAANYESPIYRWLMTLVEIGPVAVIVPFLSALLLKNGSFLPARRPEREA